MTPKTLAITCPACGDNFEIEAVLGKDFVREGGDLLVKVRPRYRHDCPVLGLVEKDGTEDE